MKPDSNLGKQMAAYGVVFSALFFVPGICIYLGWKLTTIYQWPSWAMLIFVFVGMVGAFLQIYRYFRRTDDEGNQSTLDEADNGGTNNPTRK